MSRANPRAKSVNDAKRDAEAAAILKRQRQIVIADAYFKDRKTFRAIGKMLGVSAPYVHQLLDEMKADGIARYEQRASTLIEDELEFLQQREQFYIEALDSARPVTEITQDVAEPTGSGGSGEGPGRMRVYKSMRTRQQKPLPTAPIDGLMKVSNARIKLIEMIQKQEIIDAEKNAANKGSTLDQMTPQERAITFVHALASMAARADKEQGRLPQSGRPGRVLEEQAVQAVHGIPPNPDGHTFGMKGG